jgi:hypothetical protein
VVHHNVQVVKEIKAKEVKEINAQVVKEIKAKEVKEINAQVVKEIKAKEVKELNIQVVKVKEVKELNVQVVKVKVDVSQYFAILFHQLIISYHLLQLVQNRQIITMINVHDHPMDFKLNKTEKYI